MESTDSSLSKSGVEDALRKTLHELQVHQIELETQNEELRRTQVLLDESKARYFDLYDLAPVGYCSLTEEGVVLEANLAASAMFGSTRDAISGEKISRFITPEHQDIYFIFRQMSFKKKRSQTCDLKMLGVSGETIWVSLVSNWMRDSQGLPLLRLVMTDVTDRKLMAAAMQLSEERYRAIVHWSPEPTLVHSEGKVLYVNQAAIDLLGAKGAHEVVNTQVTDWIRCDFHEAIRARWHHTTELFVPLPMSEQIIVRKNGEERNVEVRSLTTLFNDKFAIQNVARDVTERKRTEKLLLDTTEALREAKVLAEQANAAKSDFLSSMGHDLRTPLHSIIGYAQLLETGNPPLVESQVASLKQVISAGWYLLKLINELLNLASIEAGQFSVTIQAVALEAILRECESMLNPQAIKHNVSITRVRSKAQVEQSGDCSVLADSTRLKQVVCNLLSNAIKYNRVGGTVRIECICDHDETIRINFIDTGQGLSKSQLTQLFQPFHRLGKVPSADEGTGIGLVVSKRLIEIMGGTIGVKSVENIGSTFWIELPRTQTQELPT
jgi:PAS domain S-box-containing protein